MRHHQASSLKNYHRKWYSVDSWRDIIDQTFEIKTALAFTGVSLNNAISKYNNFKHVIKELYNTNQWGIYSWNYHHERKYVHLFQSIPFLKSWFSWLSGWFPHKRMMSKKQISPQKMQAWHIKIYSPKNWFWVEVATVIRNSIKKINMMLSMFMMHQLTIVPTNEHGFLI